MYLKFYIGDGSLLLGLEIALRELKEQSSAIVVCKPAYAYGPHGCPPRIPAQSTIVFWVKVHIFTQYESKA